MPESKIQYESFDSPLGEMIAGASARGVCFLEWNDRGGVGAILERIEKRYKTRSIYKTGNRYIVQLKDELKRYFKGNLKNFEVEIAVMGTPFEQSAWDELLRIPYGQTRSYGEQARSLGKPGAMRAVGRANGVNYLSILIPCHRVIGADGKLCGYGGKLWRKEWLLNLESGAQPQSLPLNAA